MRAGLCSQVRASDWEKRRGFEPVRMRFLVNLVILGNFVTTLFANRAKSVLMTVWFELSSAIIR